MKNIENPSQPVPWYAVTIVCPPDHADDVSGLLYAAGSQGAEIREDRVIAYFPTGHWTPRTLQRHIRTTLRGTGFGNLPVAVKPVPQEPWHEGSRRYFKPVRISERIVVLPDWTPVERYRGRLVIRIYPGQGFGTGHHASTKIFLRLIEDFLKPGDSFLDAGCGSGIATIAALKLGAGRCTAVDLDRAAVVETRRNLGLNGLAGAVRPLVRDMRRFHPRAAAVAGANMLLSEIESSWAPLLRATAPGGVLLLSGLLGVQIPQVRERLQHDGFRVERIRRSGEWAGLAAKRESKKQGTANERR